MYEVYIANLKTLCEEDYDYLYRKLSYERRDKIQRYKNEADKRRSFGVAILLEYAKKRFGILGKTDIAYTENKKPYFKYLPQLHFNLSHSGNTVMCIFGHHEVGCDVEKMNNLANMDIARRFFFCDEYQALLSAKSRKEQLDTFFSLWTLKESFIKCVGAGLSIPLDSFCITREQQINVVQNIYPGRFSFCEIKIPDATKCSYCIKDYYGDGFTEPKFLTFPEIKEFLKK